MEERVYRGAGIGHMVYLCQSVHHRVGLCGRGPACGVAAEKQKTVVVSINGGTTLGEPEPIPDSVTTVATSEEPAPKKTTRKKSTTTKKTTKKKDEEA